LRQSAQRGGSASNKPKAAESGESQTEPRKSASSERSDNFVKDKAESLKLFSLMSRDQTDQSLNPNNLTARSVKNRGSEQ